MMQDNVLGIPPFFDRYGIPIIVFESRPGDSTFFMAAGHGLDWRAIAATASWVRRVFKFEPLLGLTLAQYVEEAYARVTPLPGSPEMDSFDVDFFVEDNHDGVAPVTFGEF